MTAKERIRNSAICLAISLLIASSASFAPSYSQNAAPEQHLEPRTGAQHLEPRTGAQLRSIREYIKGSWHTLMRSNARLADAAVDPKFATPGGRWPVYLSTKENIREVERTLRAQMSPESFAKI
ncbi:MAG TPA: hypothetical protein VKF81_11030, partial [Blastocatellia bacterium]|nr:hypothetical protein [Blastocatellia bacterium]